MALQCGSAAAGPSMRVLAKAVPSKYRVGLHTHLMHQHLDVMRGLLVPDSIAHQRSTVLPAGAAPERRNGTFVTGPEHGLSAASCISHGTTSAQAGHTSDTVESCTPVRVRFDKRQIR